MTVFRDLRRSILALSLKDKVYSAGICFLAIVGLLVAIGVYSAAQQAAYRAQLHVASQAAVYIERANGLIFAVVMESRGIYMSSDAETVKRYGDALLARNQELAEIIAEWQQITRDDDAELFAAFKGRIQEFIRFRAELVRRANVIGQWAGRDWGDNEANRTVRKALNADLVDLAKIYQGRTTQIAAMGERAWLMTWLMPVLGIAALALAGFVALLVKRSAIGPLHDITAVTDRIAEGKTVFAVPHLDREDEIGRLAKAVRQLQVTIGRNHELQRLELMTSKERDKLAGKLTENQIQLQAAIDNMAQGIVMFDAKGGVVLLNETYLKLYKLPRNIVNSNCSLRDIVKLRAKAGLFSGDIEAHVQTALARMSERKPSIHHIELKDGRVIRVVGRPMPRGGWVATHEDCTEQRQVQRALERTEQFLVAIIENVREAIVAKDPIHLRYIFVNRAAEALFGLERSAIIGKTAHDLFGADAAEGLERDDRILQRPSEAPLASMRILDTPGNGKRLVAIRKLPLLEHDGKTHALLSLIEDHTDAQLPASNAA